MRDIGPPLSDTERQAFIVAARSYLGVRFKHQGRSRFGLDCIGLPLVALRDIGRTAWDSPAYGRTPVTQGLRDALVRNLGEPVPRADMREGDIALMAFIGEPSHVGIVTNYPEGGFALLHTFAQVKKVVEHRMDETWLGYITEVFRP